MAPTRVLIHIDQFFSPDGGTEQQLRGLLAGLDRDRVAPELVVLRRLSAYVDSGDLAAPTTCLGLGRIASPGYRRDLGFWYTPARLFWLRAGRRFTRRWLANSEAVRATVCARECAPAARVDVIPNALDLGPLAAVAPLDIRAELRLPPGTAVLVLPANLRPVKGVDLGNRGRLAAWGRQARARVASRQDAGAVVRRYEEIYHAAAAGGTR
ncbi:MAG: hypothetical protein IH621_18160 [Krumholzibacteria bacterium]|nr:hypothetical protein [Candidatus Krumholzibacteria bacterium]